MHIATKPCTQNICFKLFLVLLQLVVTEPCSQIPMFLDFVQFLWESQVYKAQRFLILLQFFVRDPCFQHQFYFILLHLFVVEPCPQTSTLSLSLFCSSWLWQSHVTNIKFILVLLLVFHLRPSCMVQNPSRSVSFWKFWFINCSSRLGVGTYWGLKWHTCLYVNVYGFLEPRNARGLWISSISALEITYWCLHLLYQTPRICRVFVLLFEWLKMTHSTLKSQQIRYTK